MQQAAVLVVDDDEVVARSISDSLTGLGWTCDIAHDAEAALRALEQRAFDAIVLDLYLPTADGLSVMQKVHERPLEARPITILLSGHLDVPTAVRALRAGASDVVEKPVAPAELDQKIRAALRERERLQDVTEGPPESVPESEPLRALERRVIEQAWLVSGQNLSAAARRLGLPRTTLRDRLRKYGLR